MFSMGDYKRQDAFDGAVEVLLEVFPKRGSLVTMDHLGQESDKYLQQIASLARA